MLKYNIINKYKFGLEFDGLLLSFEDAENDLPLLDVTERKEEKNNGKEWVYTCMIEEVRIFREPYSRGIEFWPKQEVRLGTSVVALATSSFHSIFSTSLLLLGYNSWTS
jgi:hypothetical protein